MNIQKRFSILLALSFIILQTACSKQEEVTVLRSIEEVRAEASELSLSDLRQKVQQYSQNIQRKGVELQQKLLAVKKLSPQEMLAEKGTALKDDVAAIQSDLSALVEQRNVYDEQLKKLASAV